MLKDKKIRNLVVKIEKESKENGIKMTQYIIEGPDLFNGFVYGIRCRYGEKYKYICES